MLMFCKCDWMDCCGTLSGGLFGDGPECDCRVAGTANVGCDCDRDDSLGAMVIEEDGKERVPGEETEVAIADEDGT